MAFPLKNSAPVQQEIQSAKQLALSRRVGFLYAAGGTALATGGFWLIRSYLDKGQASLLYLPVIIACAVRFGFGPAAAGALLSFLCWDFFFLPPYHLFFVQNPRDWLSLIVFLVAAMSTAHLASQARLQAEGARAREQETLILYQTSEAISSEVQADRLLPALAERIAQTCHSSRCVILRWSHSGGFSVAALASLGSLSPQEEALIKQMSQDACAPDQTEGFSGASPFGADAGTGPGVCIPLHVKAALVGALYVAPRMDALPFSMQNQRLILALANHAAVVIARQSLADEAAQAAVLREADVLKEALLSMVTHELRTPLAAIKAAASGLRQAQSVWSDIARDQALMTINTESDRLTELVNNLLDLSRLEAGAWKPTKEWCDLGEILGTALDRMQNSDAERVEVDIAGDLSMIQVDYVQIALVLLNLLQNAAKYTSPEKPIQVALFEAPRGSSLGIHAEVRDFGAGIAPGDEEAIFARFYRSARHADSTIHGTGLGLALCRAIIEAHGGRIWARNASPKEPPGALFSFFLPFD